MIPLEFLSWWYGQGWRSVATSLARRNKATIEAFSLLSLLRTLFSPWRRIVTYPGASMGDHFNAWLDNFVSRVIGFLVRFFVLLTGVFALLINTIFSALEFVLWPFVPLLIIVCIIKGLLP